ncbi:MAG TPA: type II toxin-antitoxin system prevent-host-death family antitoxin [Thermoanaerobaculia bacterium]|nr:type II toxin-antitoxin system prevent-host-death family antitoxin [Thermoanaerobaculia bacterium]
MSEIIYNLDEAKTSLSRLVDRAASGEEIILAKAGKPLAKLVPYQQTPKPRQPGGWEGQVRISEDFDDPLPPETQALVAQAQAEGLTLDSVRPEEAKMKTQRVGVCELRQNLNQYLRRVNSGEHFEIPARLDHTELGPPPDRSHEISISEALAEQRRER